MTKRSHIDGEQKPPARALRALEAWLDDSGLRRVALVAPLGASQMQISRVFAGTGYLSVTQRRAIEKFTEGAITAAMLEGRAAPTTRVQPKVRPPIEVPEEHEATVVPAVGPAGAVGPA